MMLRGIDMVVFDLDDTLYPETQFVRGGYQAVARAFEPLLGPADESVARMWALYQTDLRKHVFDTLLTQCGHAADPELVARMITAYRTHAPAITLHDDAARALERLADRPLGLISDGPLEMQSGKVAALGLESRIGHIVLTGQWGRDFWKPHPRAFETIARDAGVAHERLVYIADNPSKDFVAPHALGWTTVHIRRADGVYRDVPAAAGGAPGHVVASLDEIKLG
jgi:putative hydrolase of the HAD superfamily